MPRSRGLTKRANKKKVEWLEEEPDDVDPIQETGESAQVECVSTTGVTADLPIAPPSPLQQKQDEAMDTFVAAMESWEAAQEVAKDAYWDKRVVERRCDARERRLAASYARKRKQLKMEEGLNSALKLEA